MAFKSPFYKLTDGNQFPAIGFGTSHGLFVEDAVNELVTQEVCMAVDNGFRMFDTSQVTKTEPGLGKALKIKMEEGAITRQDVYIITKLWCTHHATNAVAPALKQSLQKLGLQYVDLFVVHFPMSMPASDSLFPNSEKVECNDDEVSLQDTWKGMEECMNLGLTKSIGLSNFNIRQVKTVLESCKIKPAAIQVESHPFHANTKLIEFCQQQSIHVTAYCPMAKNKSVTNTGPTVLTHPVLIDIGKKHNKEPGQVALRYQIQRGNSVLCKSSNAERQQQNIKIFDFELSKEEMDKITSLDQCFRLVHMRNLMGHSMQYPFNDD